VPAREQCIRHVTADEPRPARNQDSHAGEHS
jgi:hypothetical protein